MINLGCNDHLVKSWIKKDVLSYFYESQKVENRVVDLTTTGMNRSKKVILPFRVRRWMLWWGHSPLPHWECWYPPGAWHSRHSVASWEEWRNTEIIDRTSQTGWPRVFVNSVTWTQLCPCNLLSRCESLWASDANHRKSEYSTSTSPFWSWRNWWI